ncbi:MAG: nucleotidyltransferase family protein [Rubellimicrobium sp.]|nr:nucleotidyltransferase family protein [Rubellimicrobium sp.]
MNPGSAMIFAAGLGTRMGALTRERPKPLIPVGGRALIDHTLDLTGGRGLRVCVNLHYRAGMLRAHLAGRGLLFSDESARLLETGGGLKAALPILGAGPVVTLNSDAIWTGPAPLGTLAGAWDGARMEALLLLVPAGAATGHAGPGDFTLAPDGRLRRGPGLVYGGAQILRTEAVAAVPDEVFSLNKVWDAMIARGTLFGAVHRGGWCDVGHPESIALAEDLLRRA